MAAWDQHLYCPTCREKKVGLDPCIDGNPCTVCESFTQDQWKQLRDRRRYSSRRRSQDLRRPQSQSHSRSPEDRGHREQVSHTHRSHRERSPVSRREHRSTSGHQRYTSPVRPTRPPVKHRHRSPSPVRGLVQPKKLFKPHVHSSARVTTGPTHGKAAKSVSASSASTKRHSVVVEPASTEAAGYKDSILQPSKMILPLFPSSNDSDSDSDIAQLQDSKKKLMKQVLTQRLQVEIDALRAQLGTVASPLATSSPTITTASVITSTASVTTSTVTVSSVTPQVSVSVSTPVKVQPSVSSYESYYTQSRSMSPVYSGEDEPYDPLHPEITSAQKEASSHHSPQYQAQESYVERDPDTLEETSDTMAFSRKIGLVLDLLKLEQPYKHTDSPYTKSARPPSPKPINTALPAVQSFKKAFTSFQNELLTRGESTTKGVRPPTFPRWYRPVESSWSVSEQSINSSWAHLRRPYAKNPLVKFSDAEARSYEKVARESLAITSFSDQCLAAIMALSAQMKSDLEPFHPAFNSLSQLDDLIHSVATSHEQLVKHQSYLACALTLQRRDALISGCRAGISFSTKHKLRSSDFASTNLFEEDLLKEAKVSVEKATESSYSTYAMNKPVQYRSLARTKRFSNKRKHGYTKPRPAKKARTDRKGKKTTSTHTSSSKKSK